MSKEVLSDLSVKGTLSIPKTGGGEMNVQQEIESKQATLSFDSTPTASSTNPVTSGGVYTALGGKVDSNSAITAGTKCKITYDAKGLVTAGADLTATDIPNLATSKITSGTFADARIPALAISKITGLQSALDSKLNTTLKGAVNGLAELDANGKVPSSQLPSYVDDVLEFANKASFPSTGEAGKIYIAIDDNKTYRWSGSTYVEISPSLALGETSATAYRGDRGATAFAHVSKTDNPHGVTKTQVGLGAYPTSPADLGISTATQTALDGKVDKNANIVAGTATKITYDSKGLVTAGADLIASDIPALDSAKITTGTLSSARLPVFTDSAIGAIKGSTTAGRISANADGTGSVNGWDSKANVSGQMFTGNLEINKPTEGVFYFTRLKDINDTWGRFMWIHVSGLLNGVNKKIGEIVHTHAKVNDTNYTTAFGLNLTTNYNDVDYTHYTGPRMYIVNGVPERFFTFETRVNSQSTDGVNYSQLLSAQSDTITTVANTYARADAVGVANGIAGLDATGKVPTGQLPIKTYSGTITGNNSATTFSLTHGLGVVPKSITIREVSTGKCIEMATTTTSTQIILSVNTAIPTGVSYNIYAIG